VRETVRSDVALKLHYADETPYGSGVSGLLDLVLQRSCRSLLRAVAREGFTAVQDDCRAWNRRILSPTGLGGLYESADCLREACVYPPRELVRPVALYAGLRGKLQRIDLGSEASSLAPRIAAWSAGERHHAHSPLFDALREVGAFGRADEEVEPILDGVTYLGHAALAIQAQGTRILFDPFLPPAAFGRSLLERAARPDAVFITHSHPDHFDPIGLARLAAGAEIFVPAVDRESALATDMAFRLKELGFSRVTAISPGAAVAVGPLRVHALPFYGEQPSDGAVLHPSARNEGNTYLCEGLGRRVAIIADAGRDASGSTLEVARAARAAHGDVDMLFGGYRAWRMRPVRLLCSSVARYFLFVPPAERERWHKIMNDADDLVATGVAWGARHIVPYANGGTADYARIGLGPPLTGGGDVDVDPDVHEVVAAAAARGEVARVKPMQAGDCEQLFQEDGRTG
jgi:L-ascorbate metabolism protein UlaG (beta-lactamase superfamily)